MKDKVTVRSLRPYEKVKLRRLKNQRRNAVNSHHARIVLLSTGRMANRRIATLVDCSVQWVRQVLHRFNEQGISGITWYPWFQVRSERVFTVEIRERIAEIALCSPIGLIGMTQWSVPKLRQYLIEQKIIAHISIRWLGEILHRYKVRLRRTKTWKESTDPLFAEKYRAIRRLYRHRPANGRRLCIDEFGPLNLQPRHGFCNQGPGKRIERFFCVPPTTAKVESVISWRSTIWKPIDSMAGSRRTRKRRTCCRFCAGSARDIQEIKSCIS